MRFLSKIIDIKSSLHSIVIMENKNTLKEVEDFLRAKTNIFKVRSYVYEGIIKVDEYIYKDLKIELFYCDEKLRHIIIKSSDLNKTFNNDESTQNIAEIIEYIEDKLKK
ncbi:hypothetical protein SULI_14715 [Saccharolobus solfataricus]|uniref:Uncharacterized protein n=4 Tax=Saccharolobus solfataricus TaxID=2287 RepID=A0A0E3K1W0_SACSO|nr:hypothetical protein [Saccharolobus solfataricus]AKA74936.1 hypothetical protein SULB_2884 [Saccharolobus solfataricus]AKA77632.1 hypothetical protein SULC_2881 [Saccharolobus solfataricus]AKA80323.1 hypothetical protein SULA_2884 [Saccharolobus solfataricus]AZF69399.1 hypothetical protein SULG_14715 [Saccharolobus solfataricus]AZF72019.1 hypothetical protein SULH_14715 [Saccharolobus solfataricus]